MPTDIYPDCLPYIVPRFNDATSWNSLQIAVTIISSAAGLQLSHVFEQQPIFAKKT